MTQSETPPEGFDYAQAKKDAQIARVFAGLKELSRAMEDGRWVLAARCSRALTVALESFARG